MLIKIYLCLKVKDSGILNDKGEIENYYELDNSNILYIIFFCINLLKRLLLIIDYINLIFH